ncbi:hypothetical protein CLU79DRAFT_695119 [Phycomyces nitens]|nr:hypothetical protein CLU79DRAFT_695119 [Phycomyces nitens]
MDMDTDTINCTNFPLSYNSIASMLAISIYDLCLYDENSEYPCLNIFPLAIDLLWIGREFSGILMNLLTNPANGPYIDKALFVLFYLSDNVETEFTLETLDKKIKGPLGDESEFPAPRALEIVSSVASLSENPSIRFISHQFIANTLEMSNDEVRMFALRELLERCPYPAMKTAAIGLFKDQINRAFGSKKEGPPSVFSSPVIVDKFFPILFRASKSWCTEEEKFWDDYSYQMQALNLYLYLLICDKAENKVINREILYPLVVLV